MFYITISNGLLEGEHRKKMGSAVWEFMWLIDKITKIDNGGMGWVLGGKPINLTDFKGIHRITVSKNLSKLEKHKYITIQHTPYGLIIKVVKAKKRFSNNAKPYKGRISNNAKPLCNNAKPNKTVVGRQYQLDNIYIQFLFLFYRERIRKTIELTPLAKEKCAKAIKSLPFRALLLAIYNKSCDEWWMSNIATKWSFARFLSHKKLEEYAQENNQLPDSLFNKPELSDLLKKIRELKNESH